MGHSFPNEFLYEFVTLFAVLDPSATVSVFLAVTAGLTRRQSLQVAAYAVGMAFLVLLFFIGVGQNLLVALKLPMASFQLAGSIVLLLFGLKLVFGQVTDDAANLPADSSMLKRAIYPLAVPTIAGGGAMLTVVMLTDNNTRTFGEQVATTVCLALCLVLIFCIFAGSKMIFRLIGRPGVEIMSRVSGLILASIAANGIVIAVKLSFGFH